MRKAYPLCLGAALLLASPAIAEVAGGAPAALKLAAVVPMAVPQPGAPVTAVQPLTSPQAIEQEASRLRAALAAEVPQSRGAGAGHQPDWIALAHKALDLAGQPIDRPQLVVVVDRNPSVQGLRIILARPELDAAWEMIGGTHVSTGTIGRFDHYITPVGVFPHSDAILDFRAEGTFNENHIRGYGVKGMRIWDFGWHAADKGWTGGQTKIRLMMHATDPAYLESRLGSRASSGCVRIPAKLNLFMDHHGVLDYDYERVARDDRRYRSVLPPDRVPTPLAGTLLVVIDSSPVPKVTGNS